MAGTYRLIALDMDGTLLTTGKRVSPATSAALRRLSDSGACATIATGRAYRELEPLRHDLAPVRYAVCANGAVVMDLWERRSVSVTTIPNHGAIQAVRAGLSNGCLVNVLTQTGAYLNLADVERADELGLGQYKGLWAQVNEQMDDPIRGRAGRVCGGRIGGDNGARRAQGQRHRPPVRRAGHHDVAGRGRGRRRQRP